jgi:bidirectional [NiFe] hydrogenase diaphorase subunit
MIKFTLNGLEVEVEEGTTLLEAARFYGFPIPTLCYNEGLSPYGACRLCVVEIGEGARAKLVSSCTYPAQEGLVVRTASAHDVRQQRFKQEYEDCIMCGLCVRMCEEQMMAKAIGFRGRGERRSIGTPFDIKSDECRLCGGCIYICPACQLRCTYTEPEKAVCGGCANLAPPCVEKEQFHDMMCYMDPCVACEIEKE